MDFIEVNRAVLDAERAALDAFGQAAATEARLCDEASTVLLCALQLSPKGTMGVHQDMRTGALDGDVDGLFLAAHYVLGVRTFRTVRAARAVLAAGWEPEVAPHIRVLLELQAHQRVIDDDPSGREALRWLKGKAGDGITAKVAALGVKELYVRLLREAHGDPRATALVSSGGALELGPVRGAPTPHWLMACADVAIDQAKNLADRGGIRLDGFDEYDVRQREAWDRLRRRRE